MWVALRTFLLLLSFFTVCVCTLMMHSYRYPFICWHTLFRAHAQVHTIFQLCQRIIIIISRKIFHTTAFFSDVTQIISSEATYSSRLCCAVLLHAHYYKTKHMSSHQSVLVSAQPVYFVLSWSEALFMCGCDCLFGTFLIWDGMIWLPSSRATVVAYAEFITITFLRPFNISHGHICLRPFTSAAPIHGIVVIIRVVSERNATTE